MATLVVVDSAHLRRPAERTRAENTQVRKTAAVATITVGRTTGITEGLAEVPPALRLLRERMLCLAAGMTPDLWSGPSRCDRWSVHHVMRHVRDACRLHVTHLQGDPSWSFDKSFDNRTTPDEWLSDSVGETPEQTVDDLRRWSADEGLTLLERVDSLDQVIVPGPYGPIPLTLLSMHVFWDGWLHDRDVAQVTGSPSPSNPVEDAVAAAYGLFIASLPALVRHEHIDVTVSLSDNDRHYVARIQPGNVQFHTADVAADADLHGPLAIVVDALAGRGPQLADVLPGDKTKREPLTWLRGILMPVT